LLKLGAGIFRAAWARGIQRRPGALKEAGGESGLGDGVKRASGVTGDGSVVLMANASFGEEPADGISERAAGRENTSNELYRAGT